MNAELIQLPLVEPFRIAHGSSSHRVMLRVEHDGLRVEVPFVPYYNDDPLEALQTIQRMTSPDGELAANAPRQVVLVCDLLRHSMQARAAGMPVWSLLKLPDPNGVRGCRSIGIPEDMCTFRQRVAELAAQFRVIKLKLGTRSLAFDLAIVASAREAAPDATLLVDANGGWSVANAASIIPQLAAFGVEAVEQPVNHRMGIREWTKLRAALPEPGVCLIADESVQRAEGVAPLAGLAGGINVKLLKCGGIGGALRMMEMARQHQMKVMLGCMIETQSGIGHAAQLAGLADWIDLDGHFYLPDEGLGTVRYDENGALRLVPD